MFDINAAIGHWPFRRIPHQSADALRAHLEGYGMRGAAVANTHGLFYKNAHDANLELAEAIAPHGDFFAGVATLNPTYAAWERDLAACAGDLGMRALRIAPQYHDYAIGDACTVETVRAAAELGLPVLVPHRVVDIRQRHWRDTETTNAPGEVAALARAVPEARIVFTEYLAPTAALAKVFGDCPNVLIETSRLRSAYGQELAATVRALGAGRVAFGTGAPFKEVTPALLRVENADLSDEEREKVTGGNARELGLCR